MNQLRASHKVFRCTRVAKYKAPSCPGRVDLTAREGYYVDARDVDHAREQMAHRFPEDVKECGGDRSVAFTADEQ